MIHVHRAVQPILPRIHNQNRNGKLHQRNDTPVNGLGRSNLPRRKRWRKDLFPVQNTHHLTQIRISSSSKDMSPRGIAPAPSQTDRINAHQPQHHRNRPLRQPYPLRPHGHIVVLPPKLLRRIKIVHGQPKYRLYNLLQHHVPKHVPSRRMVALQQLGGGVQSVPRENIIRVDDVKEQRCYPVRNDW
jgi:hypothetical protein